MINILNIVATLILGFISLGIFYYIVFTKYNSEIGIDITIFVITVIIIIPSIHFYLDNKLYFDNLKDIKICLNMSDENLEFDFIKLNKPFFYINNENFKLYNDINIRLKSYILNIKENKNNKQVTKNWLWIIVKWIFTVVIGQVLGYYLKSISIERFNDNIMDIISILILLGMIIYIISDINSNLKKIKQNRENRINNLLMYIQIELENRIENYILGKEKNTQDKEKVILDNEKWIYINNK